MNIAVFGAGAWGTAVAIHIDRLGERVTLVPRRLEHALAIAKTRENADYLPDCRIGDSLQIGLEVLPVLMEAEVIFLACPVKGLRPLCEAIAQAADSSWNLKLVIALCKGLEPETFKTPCAVIREILPTIASGNMSGPTYARELAMGAPTAITLAVDADSDSVRALQSLLSNSSLRVYRSEDLTGVELAGALKNPFAIGAGICDGLQLGDNAKAAYLTRALAEMVRIGVACGGQPETFYGLSGFGDFVATATGPWSRNRSFGEAIGKGKAPAELIAESRNVIEGYTTTNSFSQLCAQKSIEAPILEQLEQVLYQGADPQQALQNLMARPLKAEQ